jgi:hypothetical protein
LLSKQQFVVWTIPSPFTCIKSSQAEAY